MTRISEDHAREICDQYQGGASVRTLAAWHRLSPPGVTYVLRRRGVEVRPARRQRGPVFQIVLARARNRTLADIAAEHGVTPAQVCNKLRAIGATQQNVKQVLRLSAAQREVYREAIDDAWLSHADAMEIARGENGK